MSPRTASYPEKQDGKVIIVRSLEDYARMAEEIYLVTKAVDGSDVVIIKDFNTTDKIFIMAM